jgi:hypothetical protein
VRFEGRLLRLLLPIALPAVVAACAPSPKKVCARKMELVGERWDRETYRAGMLHCIEEAKKQKQENPKLYACRAECVMSSKHLTDAADCDKKCQ